MNATTWEELIAQKNPAPIVLLEVMAGQQFVDWEPAGGGLDATYRVAVAQAPGVHSFRTISAVKQDGVFDYTERASAALVDANPASFFHDTSDGYLYISTPPTSAGSGPNANTEPYDKMIVGEFMLAFSGGSPLFHRSKKPVVFNGVNYLPVVDPNSLPVIVKSSGDSLFGVATVSGGDVTLLNANQGFNPLAARYQWTGRQVVILMGGDDLPYSEYRTIYTGNIRGYRINDRAFTLVLKDGVDDIIDASPLERITRADMTREYHFTHMVWISPTGDEYTEEEGIESQIVQRYTILTPWHIPYYGYSGGVQTFPPTAQYYYSPFKLRATDLDENAEESTAIGKVKPILYGRCRGVTPIPMAANRTGTLVMSMISGSPIHSISALRDRTGAIFNRRGCIGCYVDPVNGVIITHNAVDTYVAETIADPTNYILLDPAYQPYTVDVVGVYHEDDGTPKDNPADVITDIVERSGEATFNSDSVDTARTQLCLFKTGYKLVEPKSTREALEPILRSCQAHLFLDQDGEFRIVVSTPRLTDSSLIELRETLGDDLTPPETSTDDFQFLRLVQVSFLGGGSNESLYASSGVLREAKGLVPVSTTLFVESPFSDEGSAILAAKRIARSRSTPIKRTSMLTRMRTVNAELLSLVKITRDRLPIDAREALIGRLYRSETSPARMTQKITIVEMGGLLETPGTAFFKEDETPLAWGDATAGEKLTIGFWTDDDGYVDGADGSSYRASLYY